MSTNTTQNQEVTLKAFKNFRTNVDIENFYRFVHENDLRREAKVLLEMIAGSMKKPGKRKKRGAKLQ